jgi:hypothetical protein
VDAQLVNSEKNLRSRRSITGKRYLHCKPRRKRSKFARCATM